MFSLAYICSAMEKSREEKAKDEKLLSDVTALFMTYGIKGMTMDDIAGQLHISKKTLYRHVSDKGDLVLSCVRMECGREEEEIRKIVAKNLNAIDENIEISQFVLAQIQQVHPSVFLELEKFYPEAWMQLQDSRQGFTGEVIYNNITNGIREGLFRDDIHVEIATRLWISRINAIFEPKLFPIREFDLSEVYRQMFNQQIRGLSTPKGLEYIEKRIEPKLNRLKL